LAEEVERWARRHDEAEGERRKKVVMKIRRLDGNN
jgi:hypothetical protein